MNLVRIHSRLAPAIAGLILTACGSGHSGVPGADGDDGKPPAKPGTEAPGASVSINVVEPHVGLVARALEVTIATSGPLELANAKVSFGDGIEVIATEVRAGALVAAIEIAPEATLGKHDVILEAAGRTLTAKSAFVVAVPLDTKVRGGKAEQGGLVRLEVSNRDQISFDPENFTLLSLASSSTPSLVGLKYEGFTATDGSVVFLGDPLAKTGPLGFVGFNDLSNADSPSYLTTADAVTVGARSPEPLTSGSTLEKTFAGDLETGFFSADLALTANEGLVVEAWARVPDGSTMQPLLLAYPKSGSASDLLAQAQNDPGFPLFGIPATEARVAFPVTDAAAAKAYFVVVDSALAAGPTVKVALDYRAVRATITREKTDAHGTADTAQNIGSLPGTAAAVPGKVITGSLATAAEVDFYKFTGLSAVNVTDTLVSVASDGNVVVRVDTVPTFDSPNLVEVYPTGTTGAGVTADAVGATRYIQVAAADGAGAPGNYSLGIKRLAPAVTP